MNRKELQELSRIRVREARCLLRTGFPAGAYYLVGYAVECALKACVAKQIKKHDFPDKKLVADSYTHDLVKLLSLSGLKADLENETSTNQSLERNWAVVKDWSEETRYSVTISKNKAQDLFNACQSQPNGILRWLKTRW